MENENDAKLGCELGCELVEVSFREKKSTKLLVGSNI